MPDQHGRRDTEWYYCGAHDQDGAASESGPHIIISAKQGRTSDNAEMIVLSFCRTCMLLQ